jgi:hypothetical protein
MPVTFVVRTAPASSTLMSASPSAGLAGHARTLAALRLLERLAWPPTA